MIDHMSETEAPGGGISNVASKGGLARAAKMSREERSASARLAVEARWMKEKGIEPVPRATHAGTLRIGDLELACAVLENGERVLSERGFLGALGIRFGGILSAARKNENGAAVLPMFVGYRNLRPFIDNDLTTLLANPVKYRLNEGGKAAHGVRAELIPRVCDVWLKARDARVLRQSQFEVAVKADIIMRGLATVGIVALVDEATGYQDERERRALAKILEAFVAKELRPWVHTFPVDYYRELYRLKGKAYPPVGNRMPRYFGQITNDTVYARLAPGVLDELKRVTPRYDSGRLKHHLHRRLTDHVGHPKLLQHLGAVVALMKISPDNGWDQFVKLLDRAYPRQTPMPLFEQPARS